VAISTYNQLRAAVGNWLVRADLADRIPEFITLAEAKFNRVLSCPQMEKRSYTNCNLSADEPEFITLPADFQAMRRIRISGVEGKPRLQFLTGEQADELRYSIRNNAGRPTHFTVHGEEIELIPTPDDDYEIEMVYRGLIPALASNSTNWLLELAPDAYLYGSLMEAAPYVQDDALIEVWAQGLSLAIEGLNRFGDNWLNNAGPLSITVPGYNP
jgi:hypothetical protein